MKFLITVKCWSPFVVVVLLQVLSKEWNVHGFCPIQHYHHHYYYPKQQQDKRSNHWSRLLANKKTRSTSTTTNNRGGSSGFGTKKEKKPSKESSKGMEDYVLFPPLEPHIVQTLIPSSTESTITNEIYQRLDQIYGFPRFNYDSSSSNEKSLLSTPSSSSTSTTTSTPSLQDLITLSDSTSATPTPSTTTTNLSWDRIPAFSQVNVLHIDPLILSIPHFFTPEECCRYIAMSTTTKNDVVQSRRSPTVGKDSFSKAQRTSTTRYHPYSQVPELMVKATRLLGLDTMDHWEEPQTVRYRRKEQFTWHLDALGPNENQKQMGGQRIATLLVYLTDMTQNNKNDDDGGGATIFRDLVNEQGTRLRIRPEQGTALLFFPAAGGIPNTPYDIRTLHCGEMISSNAVQDKWITQLWLREYPYTSSSTTTTTPSLSDGNQKAATMEAMDQYCRTFYQS